jgi:pimeloyl-ACP methyl ester carboxylesterase
MMGSFLSHPCCGRMVRLIVEDDSLSGLDVMTVSFGWAPDAIADDCMALHAVEHLRSFAERTEPGIAIAARNLVRRVEKKAKRVIVPIVLMVCGSLAASGQDARPVAPGVLVDVGGYRVHLHCTGEGSPGVMIAGAAFSFDWELVQREVAKVTRVCTYDPSGTTWSDLFERPARALGSSAAAPSCGDRVTEIHRVIGKAAMGRRFILVGYSVGALWSRLEAAQYPRGIAGMVIVDQAFLPDEAGPGPSKEIKPAAGRVSAPVLVSQASIELGFEDDANFSKLPQADQEMHRWAVAQRPIAPGETMARECFAGIDRVDGNRANALRDLPLAVVHTGNGSRGYGEMQEKLLGLSRRSREFVAGTSTHMVLIDEPEVVVEAIRETVEAARER